MPKWREPLLDARLRPLIEALDHFDRYASVDDGTPYAGSPFQAEVRALLASLDASPPERSEDDDEMKVFEFHVHGVMHACDHEAADDRIGLWVDRILDFGGSVSVWSSSGDDKPPVSSPVPGDGR